MNRSEQIKRITTQLISKAVTEITNFLKVKINNNGKSNKRKSENEYSKWTSLY